MTPDRWRRLLPWALLLALAVALVAVYLTQARSRAAAGQAYNTAAVTRGDLLHTVTANGSLQPTHLVNIGSELSGTVSRVLVDVNDHVRQGDLLVELDTAKLRDQVVRSRAALAVAEAEVAQAMATRTEADANLARLAEVARLSGGKVPSRAELDTARAVLARAHASERAAQSSVVSAKAALSTDETNLGKASIRAPISGVILSRNVEPGYAVAAALQAVTLFGLAEDLRSLRLLVNVDEADVGSVAAGMPARFSVSAYPARRYPATITRVAYGPTVTDNVVTYVTYLDVDNADLSLRPGMTATATIEAAQRKRVLLVPNSALRFVPTRAAADAGFVSKLLPRMPPRAPRKGGVEAAGAEHQVWVLRSGVPQAVDIRTGISDGRETEVVGGPLQEGDPVITGQRAVPP